MLRQHANALKDSGRSTKQIIPRNPEEDQKIQDFPVYSWMKALDHQRSKFGWIPNTNKPDTPFATKTQMAAHNKMLTEKLGKTATRTGECQKSVDANRVRLAALEGELAEAAERRESEKWEPKFDESDIQDIVYQSRPQIEAIVAEITASQSAPRPRGGGTDTAPPLERRRQSSSSEVQNSFLTTVRTAPKAGKITAQSPSRPAKRKVMIGSLNGTKATKSAKPTPSTIKPEAQNHLWVYDNDECKSIEGLLAEVGYSGRELKRFAERTYKRVLAGQFNADILQDMILSKAEKNPRPSASTKDKIPQVVTLIADYADELANHHLD